MLVALSFFGSGRVSSLNQLLQMANVDFTSQEVVDGGVGTDTLGIFESLNFTIELLIDLRLLFAVVRLDHLAAVFLILGQVFSALGETIKKHNQSEVSALPTFGCLPSAGLVSRLRRPNWSWLGFVSIECVYRQYIQ